MRKMGWMGSGSWGEMRGVERRRRAREADERNRNGDEIFDRWFQSLVFVHSLLFVRIQRFMMANCRGYHNHY